MWNTEDRLDRSQVVLSVNVTRISGKYTWAEVQWRGVAHPNFDDWVGLFAHEEVDVRAHAPVKYKLASVAPRHPLFGKGSTTFVLENHRAPMRFAFFYNGFANPHLMAVSDVIHVEDINRPAHLRLSLTGEPTEMLVQWTTADTKGGVVQWGTEPGKYQWSHEARDLTYTQADMCGGAAAGEGWMDPGIFHYVLLTGLEPGRRYYYTVGSDETGFSDERDFHAAPEAGPGTEVKILALADMGQAEIDGSNEQSEMLPSTNTSSLMIRDARADDYRLVVHYGDISYARGYVSQWDRFHTQMEPLISRLPYMTSPGNHERDWPNTGDRFPAMYDSGGECGVAHERRFLSPTEAQDTPWFAYEFGPIHFIHYSTEHRFDAGSEQHTWVKRALEAVDRTRTPWVIFGGHRPMYIDSTNLKVPDGDQPVAEDLRAAFEDLLIEHHVDVTFHGHHHSYQRTCPVHKGVCQGTDANGVPRGPIHMVIGNAGAGLCLNVHKQQPEIFETIHLWWGYSRVFATATELKVEMISNLDGEPYDTLRLQKDAAWGTEWHRLQGRPPRARTSRARWWWEQDSIGTPPQVAFHKRMMASQHQRAVAPGRLRSVEA